MEETTIENSDGTLWEYAVAGRMNVLWESVCKIFRKVVQFYLYKIKHVQELQRNDHPASRESFALKLDSLHG